MFKSLAAMAEQQKHKLKIKETQTFDIDLTILNGIDCRILSSYNEIKHQTFSEIRFNYPQADGESPDKPLPYSNLILQFFAESKPLLKYGGTVTVIHNFILLFRNFNVEDMASKAGFMLQQWETFDKTKFKGYLPSKGTENSANTPINTSDSRELFFCKQPPPSTPPVVI